MLYLNLPNGTNLKFPLLALNGRKPNKVEKEMTTVFKTDLISPNSMRKLSFFENFSSNEKFCDEGSFSMIFPQAV